MQTPALPPAAPYCVDLDSVFALLYPALINHTRGCGGLIINHVFLRYQDQSAPWPVYRELSNVWFETIYILNFNINCVSVFLRYRLRC